MCWSFGGIPLSTILAASFIIIFSTQKPDIISHNLGNITLVTILVIILPVGNLALDVNLLSFLDELLGHIRQLPPGYNIVPFGIGYHLSGFVLVGFRSGQGEPGY